MKKGDIVTITNKTISGKKFVEGKAKLIKKVAGMPGSWLVEFIQEPGNMYLRQVKG